MIGLFNFLFWTTGSWKDTSMCGYVYMVQHDQEVFCENIQLIVILILAHVKSMVHEHDVNAAKSYRNLLSQSFRNQQKVFKKRYEETSYLSMKFRGMLSPFSLLACHFTGVVCFHAFSMYMISWLDYAVTFKMQLHCVLEKIITYV